MFETVAPEKFSPRSRKVLYETLPLSIGLHAVAAVALLVGNHWQIEFPKQSPKMMQLYTIVAAPTPPPPPPPPAAAPKQQPTPTPVMPVQQTEQIVAPTVIPDTIPVVMPETPVTSVIAEGVTGGVEGGVEGGVVGGSLDGVTGGEVGGAKDGVIGGVVEIPDTVVVERDKPLPMVAMSQVYPSYPETARVKNWEDQLVVRYVVGKNGRVREVKVISSPEREIFSEATLKAIRHWRFRPLRENGEIKEVIHEMTVYFRLNLQYAN